MLSSACRDLRTPGIGVAYIRALAAVLVNAAHLQLEKLRLSLARLEPWEVPKPASPMVWELE